MTLTTDIRKGILAVSYKCFPKDDKEEYLMPDDEDLKEALLYYCLYRIALSKLSGGTIDKDMLRFYQSERNQNLKMFETLKTKYVGKSNTPDTGKIENIKRMTNRLVPRSNAFRSFFSKLNNEEITNHV